MPHKIEASHPTYGHVTWEIEAGSPEEAFAVWKQIVSNPRGWNRLVNNPTVAKAKIATAVASHRQGCMCKECCRVGSSDDYADLDNVDDIDIFTQETCKKCGRLKVLLYGKPWCKKCEPEPKGFVL